MNCKDIFSPLIESVGTKRFATIFINIMDTNPTEIPSPEEFIVCEEDEARKSQLEQKYRDAFQAFEYEFMKKNMHLLSPAAIAKALHVLSGREIPLNLLIEMKEECEKE